MTGELDLDVPGRVCIVDDDPLTLAALTALLQDGFDVTAARSGRDALRLVRRDPPDLVLLDVEMLHRQAATRAGRDRPHREPGAHEAAPASDAARSALCMVLRRLDRAARPVLAALTAVEEGDGEPTALTADEWRELRDLIDRQQVRALAQARALHRPLGATLGRAARGQLHEALEGYDFERAAAVLDAAPAPA